VFSADFSDLIVDATKGISIESALMTLPLSGDRLPKFIPQPWPGYPVDCLPPIVALFCKLDGSILVNNWMYETGLDFSKELNEMGANIFVSDPNRIIVNGPVKFKGGEIRVPGIIQAAMAIFIAALADPVETTLVEAEILKRRYPDITDRFRKLGADVTNV
jgi:UDP-N-acetylglucosamine 1-carboxyvinyltransferase